MPAYHFTNGRIGTTLQTLVTADRPLVVTALIACNTATANRNFDLRHVPADEEATDDHAIYHLTVIRTDSTLFLETPIFLQIGDSLQAYASAVDSVTVHVYALDYESWVRRGAG